VDGAVVLKCVTVVGCDIVVGVEVVCVACGVGGTGAVAIGGACVAAAAAAAAIYSVLANLLAAQNVGQQIWTALLEVAVGPNIIPLRKVILGQVAHERLELVVQVTIPGGARKLKVKAKVKVKVIPGGARTLPLSRSAPPFRSYVLE